jgi:hypothetical protein
MGLEIETESHSLSLADIYKINKNGMKMSDARNYVVIGFCKS